MFKPKTKSRLKRTLSSILAFAMTASVASVMPAAAEETAKYPYAIFAADEAAGITVNTDSFTLNGSAYTNGVFGATAQYPNINGTVTDIDDITDEDNTEGEETEDVFDVSRDMILIHTKLADKYFTENCDTYNEDYTYSDMNININNSVYVMGRLSLDGNISLNNAVGAVSDVDLTGGNLNGNNTVIYSKFGDIDISNSQATVNGLIYAPFGTVTIDCDNFNMNGLIIAQNVVIDGYGANINYSSSWAELVGTESEELSWTFDDWQYLADTDEDGLPNLIEKEIGSDPYNPDTDGDNLPDGYEALTLGTDPTKPDTDDNGVLDCDEDFDEDGLTNLQEYEQGTEPYNEDTDGDGLKDGEEINTYGTDPLKVDTDEDGLEDGDEIYFETDPLNPDSDGNGISDGDEKRLQTFIHEVENEDCAVTEVRVSMEGTGNLQKTTTVESIMNKDILCSDVVGLVGEPFSIETTSQFDKATLTYVVDKSKLGDTEFDNLLFLWYDEENDNFVELDTVLDEENSTVSVETTHFSRYMVVDKYEWFEAWSMQFNYNPGREHAGENYAGYNKNYTVLTIDCSGSMSSNDPVKIKTNINSAYDAQFPKTCGRILASEKFVSLMLGDDLTSIVLFDNYAFDTIAMTDDKEQLKLGLQKVCDRGGTQFLPAIKSSLDMFSESELNDTNANKRIILLSDGFDFCPTETKRYLSNLYNQHNPDVRNRVKIYTIALGFRADEEFLEEIANITGGIAYKAYTANELVDIYSEIGIGGDFDTTDTDEDGLYDAVESAGIRLQNGNIIYTDPTTKQTDSDGLEDGEEINPTPIKSERTEYNDDGTVKTVKGYYFMMKSDPREEDTDGDKYDDNIDPNPMKSDVTVTRLKSDYLSVDYATASSLPEFISWKNHLGTDAKSENISFGGNQSWFERVSGVDKDNPEYIAAQGCGLIAMADTMLYMSRKDSSYETSLTSSVSKNNPVKFEEYRDYVVAFNNEYVKLDVDIDLDIYFLWWKLGNIYTNTNDGNMGDILNDYFESNDLDLEAKWCYVENGICAEGHWFEEGTRARRIRDMLKNDIPAIISVGPGDGIKAYDIDTSSKAPAYTDANQSISNHYFTITAVIDDKIKQKNGDYDAVMYEVSTWGQKYYISEKEIRDYISTHTSLFTNVLYIEEK